MLYIITLVQEAKFRKNNVILRARQIRPLWGGVKNRKSFKEQNHRDKVEEALVKSLWPAD